MKNITHHVPFMSAHTQDRIKNSMTPHNLMLDPMIKNDPQVMNDLRIHVPGFGQPGSQSSVFSTGRRQAGYGQTTGQMNPEAAKTLLTMVSVGAMALFVVVMVIGVGTFLGDLYTLYIADMFSASPTINLGPFVATLTEIIAGITFTNIATVSASILNSGPAMLAMGAVTFLIIRNQYIKQIDTLQRWAAIMDRYIDENIQHNNESQKVTQQASKAAPAPVVEESEVQAAQNQDIDFTNPNSCGVVVIDSIDGIPYEHVDGERLESTLALIKENWGWEADKKLGYNKTARRLVETGVGYK